jgi:hypothetical protein
VEGPLQTGLLTILAPGDSIELDYVEAPQWTWVPAP